MTRPPGARIPDDVLTLAHERRTARAEQRWADADRLRAQIEAADWRVEDAGADFRLFPAHPPTLEVGGRARYGRSDAVPSRLDEAPVGVATVVIPVIAGLVGAAVAVERTVAALDATAPPGTSIVIVVDDPEEELSAWLDALERGVRAEGRGLEVVGTSFPLGPGALLNMGIRRASGPIVILVDPLVLIHGDIVSALAAALQDPTVAIAGPWGLSTPDMRRYVRSDAPSVAAIDGRCAAFRRFDAALHLPVDEAFGTVRHLDTWWSLALRDGGDGKHRSARIVPDLPVALGEGEAGVQGGVQAGDSAQGRAGKRSYYRLLKHFGSRPDLAVPAPD